MTIEHLPAMTSGWQWHENTSMSSDNDLYMFNMSADPIEFLPATDVVDDPGE